nr:TetR/AcrR family transcriptional regulator [Sphingobium sp. BHU LFT2]
MRVAAESFLKNGFAATTMSGIASQLGGSKSTLWGHFSSKEELFTAVIDSRTSTYRAHLSQMLTTPSGSVAETLRRVCTIVLEKLTSAEAVALQRLVVAEGIRFPQAGSIFYNRGPRVTQMQLAKFLSAEMESGRLRRDDPMRAARLLLSMSLHYSQQQLLWGLAQAATPEDLKSEVDRAVDVFMRAYAP